MGYGDTITLPTLGRKADDADDAEDIEIGSGWIDYEVELGVVVDERCRNVPEDEAENIVKGYTCVNGVSNRDDQHDEQNWIRGKPFEGAAPMGSVLAARDEVPDDPRIRLYVNGEQR